MRVKIAFFLILPLGLICHINGQVHHIKFHLPSNHSLPCTLVESSFLPKYRGFADKFQKDDNSNDDLIIKVSKPSISLPTSGRTLNIPPHLDPGSQVIELFSKKESTASAHMSTLCKSITKSPLLAQLRSDNKEPEVRKLIDSGDPHNRIDVVFMGDGYTAPERSQFFSDMERLTQDMFQGATFRSYLPLFNIWAIFVESEDSGIGYSGPGSKNTPFGLYREMGQLRVIWPGRPEYAREICKLTGDSGCDYPSIIANDDFYGGLGGEFVISTKSARTGTIVLRHEMGHNMADVGDEYDHSWAYFGVNNAASPEALGWTAWLSEPEGSRREERAIYRVLAYPWADLEEKGQQNFTFSSDGQYSRWRLTVSVSAAGEEDSLEFRLDGQVLPWNSTGFDDREFYDWFGNEGFSQGEHELTVRSKTKPTHPEIPRMICDVKLYEFGNEEEYRMSNDHISAYPSWSDEGTKSFRPSSEGCLMRNITYNQFCPVCKEGMWQQFLERVSLIDNVTVGEGDGNGGNNVTVSTLKLGQLRQPGNEMPGEKLEVKWFKEGQGEIVDFRDQFTVLAGEGEWEVEVKLITPEVRADPRNLLVSKEKFEIKNFYDKIIV